MRLQPELRRVILESPYAGDIRTNVHYARRACRDSLLRNESPLVSHLLYTQPGILRDSVPEERILGIAAGLEWGNYAQATVVYTDYGISSGMRLGIDRAEAENRPVEYRSIGKNPGYQSIWNSVCTKLSKLVSKFTR